MIREDDLGLKGLKILQDTNFFSFGIDSVLLSEFIKNKKYMNVLDIGCGNGILPLLIHGKEKAENIYGVEIQTEVYELAIENIRLNKLENKIHIINTDINEYKPEKLFDAIVSNPPYMPKSIGKSSDNIYKAIARTEITCNLDLLFCSVKRLLKVNSPFYMVHKSDRVVDIFEKSRKYCLEPKRLRFIKPYPNKPSNLVLIEFIKGAKPFLKFENELIIYNPDGSYSEEVAKIYESK